MTKDTNIRIDPNDYKILREKAKIEDRKIKNMVGIMIREWKSKKK
jgi:hypothetical protein